VFSVERYVISFHLRYEVKVLKSHILTANVRTLLAFTIRDIRVSIVHQVIEVFKLVPSISITWTHGRVCNRGAYALRTHSYYPQDLHWRLYNGLLWSTALETPSRQVSRNQCRNCDLSVRDTGCQRTHVAHWVRLQQTYLSFVCVSQM
jgi:hypothetical protein